MGQLSKVTAPTLFPAAGEGHRGHRVDVDDQLQDKRPPRPARRGAARKGAAGQGGQGQQQEGPGRPRPTPACRAGVEVDSVWRQAWSRARRSTSLDRSGPYQLAT